MLAIGPAGCATYNARQTVSPDEQTNPARLRPEITTKNEAVAQIVKTAREQFHRGNLGESEETINRGLNIAPENPVLWHLLAKIRYLQENYQQAETFASRSLSYSEKDRKLTDYNWRLIGYARRQLGNEREAQRALNNISQDNDDTGWLR